jgi:hypothetical protein
MGRAAEQQDTVLGMDQPESGGIFRVPGGWFLLAKAATPPCSDSFLT